jgi:hypothetical protein
VVVAIVVGTVVAAAVVPPAGMVLVVATGVDVVAPGPGMGVVATVTAVVVGGRVVDGAPEVDELVAEDDPPPPRHAARTHRTATPADAARGRGISVPSRETVRRRRRPA